VKFVRAITLVLLLVSFVRMAGAQVPGVQPEDSLFNTSRPDLLIVIREHPGGADVIEVKAVSKAITAPELEASILELGKQIGVPPRAVRIYTNKLDTNVKQSYIEASFGIDGVVEPDKIRLNALAQSFMGPKVRALGIVIENRGVTSETVASYQSTNIEATGQYLPGSIGLEYRIRAIAADPDKFDIPDSRSEAARVQKPKSERNAGFDPSLIALIAVAAVALGALVYSLLLRSKATNR
jgi:hypothetical protein